MQTERIQATSTSKEPAAHREWILSRGNVHVATDRDCFTDYYQVTSSLFPPHGSDQPAIPILGVGTVELDVLRSPHSPQTHRIQLKDVVHVDANAAGSVSVTALEEQGLIWRSAIPGTNRPLPESYWPAQLIFFDPGRQEWGYAEAELAKKEGDGGRNTSRKVDKNHRIWKMQLSGASGMDNKGEYLENWSWPEQARYAWMSEVVRRRRERKRQW